MREINICTINCRSLNGASRLLEIENATKNIRWDIIGLSEIRRKGTGTHTLTDTQSVLYHSGDPNSSYGGTGFLVSRHLSRNATHSVVSSRVSYLDLVSSCSESVLRIVQVYAPTSSQDDDVYTEFLEDVEKVIRSSRPKHGRKPIQLVICGDFNAKVGSKMNGEMCVGYHGTGQRNDRGQTLVDFCEQYHLRITNTFYKRRESRKWTWIAPDKVTRNAIDYIIVRNTEIVKYVAVIGQFNFNTDHRLLRATVKWRASRQRQPPRNRLKQDMKIERPIFQLALKGQKQYIEQQQQQYNYSILQDMIQRAATVASTPIQPIPRISNATQRLMNRRHELRSTGLRDPVKKIEFSLVNKAIRVSLKDDIKRRQVELVRKSVQLGQGYKKALQQSEVSRATMSQLRKSDGTMGATKKDRADTFKFFYNNLYKSDVAIQLIPATVVDQVEDIIPVEVQSAIKEIKSGKSPGADGITAVMLKYGAEELLPILTSLFNQWLRDEDVPDKLPDSTTILLFKKGDIHDIANYRPISLLSAVFKLFTNVINRRVEKILDSSQAEEQAGLRRNYSTIDNIHVI